MRRFGFSLVAATAALTVAAGPATAGPNLAPASGALFGAFVKQRDGLTHAQGILAFESMIGRRLGIDHNYVDWGSTNLTYAKTDIAAGRIPMVSWPGGSWPAGVDAASIGSGANDATILATASAFKALGAPVLVRFAFEMDQPPGNGRYIGEPDAFIPAWRHVHDLFVSAGATNVAWVFCAVASNYNKGRAQAYYPGNAYVDWIAADGFNFYPVKISSISTWRSFKEMFTGFYTWGSSTGKPLMVAATGAQDDPAVPGRKATWIDNASSTIRTWPQLKAFLWWHNAHPTPNGPAPFWVDTSTSALNAYKAMGALAYFKPSV